MASRYRTGSDMNLRMHSPSMKLYSLPRKKVDPMTGSPGRRSQSRSTNVTGQYPLYSGRREATSGWLSRVTRCGTVSSWSPSSWVATGTITSGCLAAADSGLPSSISNLSSSRASSSPSSLTSSSALSLGSPLRALTIMASVSAVVKEGILWVSSCVQMLRRALRRRTMSLAADHDFARAANLGYTVSLGTAARRDTSSCTLSNSIS
mmetsp:Transcript_37244/g.86589  ORF Transcript_37244/g.86589 Transcript_37244/m.86589 type:complete len:207 (-) Transcript_37244:592-1212(-)